MKDQAQPIMQFSGYPLSLAERGQPGPVPLAIVQPEPHTQTIFIQKNLISNDPSNWDETWFSGYE